MYVHVYACMYVHIYACVCVCVCSYVCAHANTYLCVYLPFQHISCCRFTGGGAISMRAFVLEGQGSVSMQETITQCVFEENIVNIYDQTSQAKVLFNGGLYWMRCVIDPCLALIKSFPFTCHLLSLLVEGHVCYSVRSPHALPFVNVLVIRSFRVTVHSEKKSFRVSCHVVVLKWGP